MANSGMPWNKADVHISHKFDYMQAIKGFTKY